MVTGRQPLGVLRWAEVCHSAHLAPSAQAGHSGACGRPIRQPTNMQPGTLCYHWLSNANYCTSQQNISQRLRIIEDTVEPFFVLPAWEINLEACASGIRTPNPPADPGIETGSFRQTVPVGTHCVSVTWATEAGLLERVIVVSSSLDCQKMIRIFISGPFDLMTLKN